MEITQQPRRSQEFAENGIVHAVVSLQLPCANGEGREDATVNEFYERLEKAALDIGGTLLFPRAKARYESSTDPRKRFTHRPYRLEITSTHTAEGEGITVTRTLTLSHRGRELYREVAADLLLPDGRILPVKQPENRSPHSEGRGRR